MVVFCSFTVLKFSFFFLLIHMQLKMKCRSKFQFLLKMGGIHGSRLVNWLVLIDEFVFFTFE